MEIRIIGNEDGIITYEEISTKTVKQSDVDSWVSQVEENAEQIKALESQNDKLLADIENARNILALVAETEAETAEAEEE